jgi:hypothetical protein
MSEIKVNKISPRTACGTTTLGDSGDTFTIPAGVSITNSGTASGFGSTGEVSWVTTKKTATFTATAGEGYFCDTSSSAFTVNLPAGTAGNSFAVSDYTNTFQTNNLTISPNGSQKIGGVAEDAILSTEGQSAYFVYVDDTEGWKNVIDSTSNITGAPPFIVATGGTITTSGNCKIHTFTGPGTFTVCSVASCAANNVVSHVVVAGGGGGAQSRGGGGGGGGYREVVSPSSPYTGSPLNGYPNAPNRVTVTATAFPITVGAGGARGKAPPPAAGIGTNGANSIFSTITAAGGGGGAPGDANTSPYGPSLVQRSGLAGGSGGGGGSGNDGGGNGGAGNTPPVSPAQGFVGGGVGGSSVLSAGGGGATAAGSCGAPGNGNGGAGATSSINGTPTARAGGGGGGAPCGPVTRGAGGAGGGGPGATPGSNSPNTPGLDGGNGTDNTGGGGGGAAASSGYDGGNGGSGIVIIRYRFQ